jgi:hypothetical protein
MSSARVAASIQEVYREKSFRTRDPLYVETALLKLVEGSI